MIQGYGGGLLMGFCDLFGGVQTDVGDCRALGSGGYDFEASVQTRAFRHWLGH